VQKVLARAELRVAGPPEDETVLYGFAVLEPALVHMVYVRQSWRRMGIAKRLLEGVQLEACAYSTHTTDMGQWIRHKHPMTEYQPFWLTEAGNGKAS